MEERESVLWRAEAAPDQHSPDSRRATASTSHGHCLQEARGHAGPSEYNEGLGRSTAAEPGKEDSAPKARCHGEAFDTDLETDLEMAAQAIQADHREEASSSERIDSAAT